MTDSDHLRRLHFINALFAGLTGDDLYLAQQIQSAISESLKESSDSGRPESPGAAEGDAIGVDQNQPGFAAAAGRLLQRLCGGRQDHGFFWWDAARTQADATPLFTRQHVLEGLKRLAGYREATLLVTNLRPAHCPPSKRWTSRRQREYRESLAFIQDLAAARSRRSANVRLLVF